MNRDGIFKLLTILACVCSCQKAPNNQSEPAPLSRWEALLDDLPDWEWKDTLDLRQVERLHTTVTYSQAFHHWILPADGLRDTTVDDFQHSFLITPKDLKESHTWAGKDTAQKEPIMVYAEWQMGELYAAGKVHYQNDDWAIVWMLRTSHPLFGLGTRTWIARYTPLGKLRDYTPFIEDLNNDLGHVRKSFVVVENDSTFSIHIEVNRNVEIPGQPIQTQQEKQRWHWRASQQKFLPE